MSSTSVRPLRRRAIQTKARKLTASLAAIVLGLGVLSFGGTAAIAAPGDQNGRVIVSDIELLDTDGNPLTEQLTVGDEFLIQGSWDATEADPAAGETFVIGLPGEFEFILGGPPIELKGTDPETGAQETWATCVADGETGKLTCTFAEIVSSRTDIHGTFTLNVKAALETTESTVEFDLNGLSGAVVLPGGGGIDDGIDLPDVVTKSGMMNDNNWSMTWTIDIPGSSLVGAGGDIAHIKDSLGDGHALCDPVGLKVHTVRGDQVVNVSELAEVVSGGPGDRIFNFDLKAPESGFDSGVIYRVQYQTCTPDGQIDVAGTVYRNDAQIEGWGEAGHGIGEAVSKPWQQNISKSGSVLGGADRNGKIRWAISVPGNNLVGKDYFNLVESLGAGHEVGSDTISGLTVIEQYGPTGQRQSNVTAELDAQINSSSGAGFDVEYSVKDGSSFEFKASDWRYIITYYTYVTGTDLPEGGTVYANSASVDGQLASGTAKVPDRKYEKSGKLNSAPKTLDGVQHSAYTTLDWSVTIPGEKIDGLSEVHLEDVLGGAHMVCEAGDTSAGVPARLGLSVRVQDQIANGGMAPGVNDLTDLTTASVSGQTLSLKISQPDGATFSRDYQYVISYTTCTASGGVDPKGTEYTNAISGSGVERSGKVTMNYGGSGTGTGVAKGSFMVSKAVSGPGAALVPEGTEFSVHVKEIFNGVTQLEYDRMVPAGGDPVSGLNQRGRGWTFELSEPTFPAVPGVVFGSPKFTESDGITVSENGTVATMAATPKSNVSLELTNEAQLGQMNIRKVLEGPAADQVDPEKQYSFTAKIDVTKLAGVPAQADRTFTLAANESTTLENLPIGAEVSITEAWPADDDVFTWAEPEVSPDPVTITAEHVGEPAMVTVTNSVKRTVGTFELSKQITGEQADNPAVPESVTVTATWQEEGDEGPTSKLITLPTDGTPVSLGEQLLIGTTVKLSETPLSDGSGIAWGAPGWEGAGVKQGPDNTAVVTIGRAADARVVLTNHAATSTAGISLLKVLTGEAAADVPADAQFPVTATWIDANDEQQSVDLEINANSPTPLGVDLPAGTVVTITEGDRPAIDTVVWGSITINGAGDVTDNGDGSAEVIVSDQQGDVTLLSVTNEASWQDGTFSLTKKVEGVLQSDHEVPDTVEVTASWHESGDEGIIEHSKKIVVPTDGTAVDFGELLPAFTEVTLTETAPQNTERFSWKTPKWSESDELIVHEDGSATLTVLPAGTHKLSLTNAAEPKLGTIVVSKEISGAGGPSVPKDTKFTVTAEWTDLYGKEQHREVELSPAQPVVIDNMPFGTEILFTEASVKSPDGARFIRAKWASADDRVTLGSDGPEASVIVTGAEQAPVTIELDNEYQKVDHLSLTGATWTGIVVTGLALLGLGGAAILMQLRRKLR